MSGGLYDMSVKGFDRTLDLTRIKAYGDTPGSWPGRWALRSPTWPVP